MSAIVTTLLGGLLAISGGLVGVGLSDRRERSRWLRDTQLQATTNLLSALQLLVRRMINLAYLSPSESVDPTSPVVAAFHEATVEWNKALYGGLLIAPPDVAAEFPSWTARLIGSSISRSQASGRGLTLGTSELDSVGWPPRTSSSPAQWRGSPT
jgi:hypothetical protein